MGNIIEKLQEMFTFTSEKRMVMIGLDAAGKTTLLYNLKLGEVGCTQPTIGFNVEKLTYKKMDMTVWDIGGQHRLRALWKHYYTNTDAVIFVVDTSDHDRIDEAKEELQRAMAEDELRNAALLVFANKSDMDGAYTPKELVSKLGLDREKRSWHIQSSIATKGDGLVEGLDWLSTTLKKKQSS